MSNINIEFDTLDCTDKIVIYKMNKQYSPDQMPIAMKQHIQNMTLINEIYKPKAIIRIMEPNSIETIDDIESAISIINNQINELNSIKNQLLEIEKGEE